MEFLSVSELWIMSNRLIVPVGGLDTERISSKRFGSEIGCIYAFSISG